MAEELETKKAEIAVNAGGAFEDDLAGDLADVLNDESNGEALDIAAEADEFQLNQDLKGFASCFPSWDLYPPTKK